MPKPGVRVFGALVLVQVLFGLHYAAAKALLAELAPEAWAAARAAAAALVLLALAAALRRRLPGDPRTLAALAALSLLGVVINQLMFVKGLVLTHTTHSSLINSSIPLLTLTLAVVLGRERVTLRKGAGLALGLAGVLLLLRPWAAPALGGVFRGDLYTLINATSYSLFLVLSRPVLRTLDAVGATAAVFGFGALVLLALGAPALAAVDVARFSPRAWGLAAYIVAGPTVGAYVLQFFALRRVESSVVALFIYLQFVIAAAIGVAFLGEPPEVRLGVAALLVFAGLAVGARAATTVPRELPADAP